MERDAAGGGVYRIHRVFAGSRDEDDEVSLK